MARLPTSNGLKNLGKQTSHVYDGGNPAILETVPNRMKDYPGVTGMVVIEGEEFTSLCPVTGGPDFGTLTITYRPNDKLVESKSLKLYLGSYRQMGMFHEQIVAKVCHDLAKLLDPELIEVHGNFRPRGGWAIKPTAVWMPSDKR